MRRRHDRKRFWAALSVCVIAACWLGRPPASAQTGGRYYTPNRDSRQGVVQCANLIYGRSKSSVCFSDEFLTQLQKDTYICTNRRFCPVKLGGRELFQYPFAVMTGEGTFTLTEDQRRNLRNYVQRGGFLVASAGCSSSAWDASFRAEMRRVFPKTKLKRLDLSHPVYHTVYDIKSLETSHPVYHTVYDIKSLETSHSGPQAYLEALEVDGKIALIYSHEGLNETSNAGRGCCCCGGNEIKNARKINVNLLAYALTH